MQVNDMICVCKLLDGFSSMRYIQSRGNCIMQIKRRDDNAWIKDGILHR